MKKKFTAVALFIVLLMGLATCTTIARPRLCISCSMSALGIRGMGICLPTTPRMGSHISTTHSIRNWLKLVMHRPSRPRISNQIFFQGERIADYEATLW